MIAIHVGLRKTGSTSIQKFLSANETTLRTMGVDYSPIGQGTRNNHVNLFYEIRSHRNFTPKFGTLSSVADYWRASENRVLLLSSEDFEAFKYDEIARFKNILDGSRDNYCIIMVIRDLVDMIPSEYSQKIRNGLSIFDFDDFFSTRMQGGGLPFFKTAKLWADSFGWQNLSIRLLDRRHLVNGDLADDFLTMTHLDPLAADLKHLKRPGVANASPGWRVLEAVRALYNGSHGLPAGHALAAPQEHDKNQRKIVGRFSRTLGEKRGWNADRGRYLTRVQAQQCLEMHRSAIGALNEKLSQKLPEPLDLVARGFVDREFMPDAEHIAAAELRAFYDELAVLIRR